MRPARPDRATDARSRRGAGGAGRGPRPATKPGLPRALWLLPALLLAGLLGDRLLDAHAREAANDQVAPAGPTSVLDMGPMPDELRESSGLAASRAHAGVFWSHNDSGDEPRLYAVDARAALLAVVRVTGAHADDWEALDIGVCPGGAAPWCLYVADIGNNLRRRPVATVHVVPEPDPGSGPGSVESLGAVRFSYPDGPADAEALAVTPEGDLAVITKWGAPVVYRIPAAEVQRSLSRGDTVRLGPGRELPIRSSFILGGFVTGASLDVEGVVLAVRTYAELHFFAWPLADSVVVAAPACFLGGLQPQGEAVALLPDGRALLSSESPGGTAGKLLAVSCEGVAG